MDAAATQPRFDGHTVATGGRFHFSLSARGYSGVALTVFAGLSAGVFAWYVAAVHRHLSPATSDLLLAAFLAGCALVVPAAWIAYSWFVSRALPMPFDDLLVADAYSFAPLLVLWLSPLAMPASTAALAGVVLLACIAIKVGVLARHSTMVRSVAIVFVATRIPLFIIAPLAGIVIGQRQGHHWNAAHGILLDVWGRWDAQHYLMIATAGYHGKDVAFFPLYPSIIHALGGFMGDHLIAGLVISNLAFFIALAYLYALVKLEFGEDTTAFHAIFYIAVFPTAIFFSAVYTESLFLALTVASVFYARRGNFITAGIFGALASLTRIEGVLTVVPLAYEAVRAWQERRGTTLARGMAGVAIVPAGLGVYMLYLYALVADPLYFMKIQDNWHRHLAPPWESVTNTLRQLFGQPLSSSFAVNLSIELAFTAAFLALLVAAFSTLRPSYAWYFAASLLMPMCTASLMSMPRFVLVIFPAFMLLALWGRKPAVNSAIVSLSLPILGLFTVLFADWYWLA
ncbi:MAG: hypothetical protein M3T49_07405 [Candidatus Eremiobacteraeota bacterium]|nr:hypothetical protein [Candidatus Eremiobacteraeota bacterium]